MWVAALAASRRDDPEELNGSEEPTSTAWAELSQEERDTKNRARAARRARTRVRRLATANRMTYLWTLTFAVEPSSFDDVIALLDPFWKRLARALGSTLPRIAVVENGSKNGRLHAHFLTNRRIPIAVVDEAWGHGFVFVSNHGQGHASARRAAGYVAKYIAKNVGDGRPGRQAYLVSEGLTTGRTIKRFMDPDEALAFAVMVLNAGPDSLLSFSQDWDDHDGPDAWWFGAVPDP